MWYNDFTSEMPSLIMIVTHLHTYTRMHTTRRLDEAILLLIAERDDQRTNVHHADTPLNIGAALEWSRKRLGMSYGAFASYLGVSPTTLWRMRKGCVSKQTQRLLALIAAYSIEHGGLHEEVSDHRDATNQLVVPC